MDESHYASSPWAVSHRDTLWPLHDKMGCRECDRRVCSNTKTPPNVIPEPMVEWEVGYVGMMHDASIYIYIYLLGLPTSHKEPWKLVRAACTGGNG